jgi:hypothetical protein
MRSVRDRGIEIGSIEPAQRVNGKRCRNQQLLEAQPA